MTSNVGPSISLRVIIYNTHGCSILWKGFKTVTKIFRFIIRRLKFAMHRHLSGMSLWASLKSMRRLNVFCYRQKNRSIPHFNCWTIQSFSITIPGAINNITAAGWMISAELAKTFLSYVHDIAFIVFWKLWCKLKTLHPINVYKRKVKLEKKKANLAITS